MSKKSGKGKKSKNYDESEELSGFVTNTQDTANNVLDIGYLTGAILDYYEVTGAPALDEGDEWKAGTSYEPKSRCNIPSELDEAVKKAFLVQIKKFHK
jgi:hypothetical protein